MNSDNMLREAELSLYEEDLLTEGYELDGEAIITDGEIREHRQGRYLWIDRLRGFTLISMIGYHLSWDLHNLFGVSLPFMGTTFSHVWQQSICWSFILLSGYCLSLGKKTYRHGVILLACAVLIRLVTAVAEPDETVRYGVLFLLGISSILAGLLRKPLEKIPAAFGLVLMLVLFFLTFDFRLGYLGYESIHLFKMPTALYQSSALAWLGFPNRAFHSGDYFPVFPWLFLFLAGFYLSRIFPPNPLKKSRAAGGFLSFLGRHSLIIYMIHQPLIYGLCYLLF